MKKNLYTLLILSGLISAIIFIACKSEPPAVNPCEGVTILITEQHTGATIANPSSGSITVSATGGTAPYTYALTGKSNATNNTGLFTGLANGTYKITVTSAAGCSAASDSIELSFPCPAINVSATSTDVTTCSPPNGTLSATASGSTGFTYSINGGTYQTSGNFTNLAAGAYTISAKDVNGCTGHSVFNVGSSTPAITVSASTTNVTLCTSNNGTISASASGSTGYTYNINGGAYQSSGNFTNLAAGAYTINAKDGGGCTGNTVKTVANSTPTITVSGTSTAATQYVCSSDGSVSVSATGGASPYTYTISGTTTSNSTGSFTQLMTGTYTITAKDANGCTGTVAKTVVGPSVSFATKIQPIISQSCGRGNITCHNHSNSWTSYSDIVGTSSGSTWTSNLSTFIGRAVGAGSTTSTCPAVGISGRHNMPPSSTTNWTNFMTGDFTKWVNQGYPNN